MKIRNIEAYNMGPDQTELAHWIDNHDYVSLHLGNFIHSKIKAIYDFIVWIIRKINQAQLAFWDRRFWTVEHLWKPGTGRDFFPISSYFPRWRWLSRRRCNVRAGGKQ